MDVVVIGASGMLGSMVLDHFRSQADVRVHSTLRKAGEATAPGGPLAMHLDASTAKCEDLQAILDGKDWAINCAGIIKPYIHDSQSVEVQEAIRVNALFPHLLAIAAAGTGCRVIQIATDCVYSGTKGSYLESDSHDARDVYGKTKSLGEVRAPGFHNLRCSIIGPERKGKKSLLEWFLAHPEGATVSGFTNHLWNGITTLQFARICLGIMRSRLDLPPLQHIVPGDALVKGELLQVMADAYGRDDLHVSLNPAPEAIDRSLGTSNHELNQAIWRHAGYAAPPSLGAMIHELAKGLDAGNGSRS